MITKTQEQGKGGTSPAAIEKIERFIQRIDPWISGGAGFFLAICGSILCFEVIFRYFYKDSHEWAPEVAMACLIWAVFLAAGPALKRGQHVSMRILPQKLGEKPFRIVSFVMYAIITVLCAIMAGKGAVLAKKSIMLGLSNTALDPFPVGYFKISIPLGMSLFTLYSLAETLKLGLMLFSPGHYGKTVPNKVQSRGDT